MPRPNKPHLRRLPGGAGWHRQLGGARSRIGSTPEQAYFSLFRELSREIRNSIVHHYTYSDGGGAWTTHALDDIRINRVFRVILSREEVNKVIRKGELEYATVLRGLSRFSRHSGWE